MNVTLTNKFFDRGTFKDDPLVLSNANLNVNLAGVAAKKNIKRREP